MMILQNLSPNDVRRVPFPHVLAHGALPDDLCHQLSREFPPLESFVRGRDLPSNFKTRRTAKHLLADPDLSPLWRQMILEHLSPLVVKEFLRLMSEDVRSEFPDFIDRFGDIDSWRIGMRGRDNYSDHEILLEAQLVIHTPVMHHACFERGPHVKRPNKLFELQLMLPVEGDVTPGAEIEVHAVRPGFQPLFGEGGQTRHEYLRLAHWLPYQPNTIYLMLNTPRSIMQIGLRGVSPHPIRYFGVLVEFSRDIFDLPAIVESANPSRETRRTSSATANFWKQMMGRLSTRAAG